MGMYAIPNHDKPGFNGMTGAPATWDQNKGMWVDTAGVEIRDDAIVATPPGPQTGSAPPLQPGGGSNPAVKGLFSSGGDVGGGGAVNIGAPSQGNPYLGQGVAALKRITIGSQAPRIY